MKPLDVYRYAGFALILALTVLTMPRKASAAAWALQIGFNSNAVNVSETAEACDSSDLQLYYVIEKDSVCAGFSSDVTRAGCEPSTPATRFTVTQGDTLAAVVFDVSNSQNYRLYQVEVLWQQCVDGHGQTCNTCDEPGSTCNWKADDNPFTDGSSQEFTSDTAQGTPAESVETCSEFLGCSSQRRYSTWHLENTVFENTGVFRFSIALTAVDVSGDKQLKFCFDPEMDVGSGGGTHGETIPSGSG